MSTSSSIRFPTTHWSLVARAGANEGQLALEELLGKYLRPLRAYLLRTRKINPAEVDDLLHGFIADKMLEGELIASASRERGRFRTFLLNALDRYVMDQRRYATRQRRRGDALATAIHNVGEPVDPAADPARTFYIEWAREVLWQALDALREECDSSARPELWGIFDGRVICPTLEGQPPRPYASLVEQFDLKSIEQAANLLVTAKRMFHRLLRKTIAEYAGDEAEVDSELVELEEILGRSRR